MELIAGRENGNQNLRLRNQDFEYPHYAVDSVHGRGVTKVNLISLDSMIENDLRRFHRNSKNEIIIIYNLSQEVYYRHNEGNPELAELAASLGEDLAKYIHFEKKRFFPLAIALEVYLSKK